MRVPSGLHLDNPSFPLLQALISYWGVTTSDGNAGGTTVVCSDLASESSYDGLTIKMLSGNAAGQARTVQHHPDSDTVTVGVAFTDAGGTAVQIVSGTRFVIITSMAGGGGPGPSPEEDLVYYGIVDSVPAADQFTIGALAGLGAGKFAGATNPYAAFVLRDAGGASAAPQGEIQDITAYTTNTGNFAANAFSAAVAVGDEILIVHPALATLLMGGSAILATGTFTTSSATVPADTGRTEADNYWRGHLLMPLTGAQAWRPTRMVASANVGGVFTVDPNNPFTAAPGLVMYAILRDQGEFVPAADGANNRTPSDVTGNKTDTIPAMNAVPGDDSIVRHVKAILERLGATPADPDDSLLTSAGQRDATATADDLSDVTTTDIQAKLRRILLRMSSDAFTADIQGAARTELDTMLGQMATYFVALGAAMSIQINGNAARTNLQQVWQDFSVVFGADGVNVFNPTIQGAARTDLDAALNILATYLTAAGAAMSIQVNGNAARTNLEQAFEDLTAVFGADGANVFNPTIQGAAQTDLDAALAQMAIYFAAAGAAMSVQVNGGAARANLELILEDYFAVVGCDGASIFSTTIQGAARTTIEAAFDGLAAYFVAAGAALSVTIDPGGAARSTLATLWNDLGQMLAGAAGITTWPVSAPPGDGVSIAEAIRQIYDDIAAVNSSFQEQADTAVNITAILASETDVFDLNVAATRYIVRSLRLKSADPGAETVTVRLYELINNVSTVVSTFSITTANYTNYFDLMSLFGAPHLAGDDLQVTVQVSGGAGVAVTGQVAWAQAT